MSNVKLGEFELTLADDDLDSVQEWDKFARDNKYYKFLVATIEQRVMILRDMLEAGEDVPLDEIRIVQGELRGYRWLLGLPTALQAEIDNLSKQGEKKDV